jgi:penicillin amidase
VTVGSGPRERRRWLLLGLAVGVLALGALVGAREAVERRALRRAIPPLDGTLELPGLERGAVLVRDARGIPHVRAASERDAWFGLGFAHAQDRLAQMTWLVRAARGRAAEAVGREAIEGDRWSRTLGFGRLADARAATLDAPTRRVLEAYAAGVNAWVGRIREGVAPAPIALARMGIEPEPWTPADSIAVAKLLAWGLDGSIDATLALGQLVDRLGAFAARPFFPPDAAADLVPVPLPRIEARAASASLALRCATGLAGRSVGSSAWVLAGRAAENGRPILAGDLHLEPTVPSLLYEAHLSAPGLELAGAGPAGVPIFWSGHNESVAWAASHARAAVADLYLETVDADTQRHRSSAGWQPLARREERIEVHGDAPERLVVRETNHGPLLDGPSEAAPSEESQRSEPAIALAWAGAQPGDGVGALIRAARAPDAGAFRAALAEHHEPALVFVYADASGAGGRQVAGWIPRRAIATALVPVPGRSGWYDWRGRIPFEELPSTLLDGASLVAADNRLADEGPIEWWWRPGERATRIEALLDDAARRAPVDAATLAALQADVMSPAALGRVRLVLELAGDVEALPGEARHVAGILRDWDGSTRAESRGAAAWHALLGALLERVLEASLGRDLLARYLTLRGVNPESLLDAILEMALASRPDPDAIVDATSLRAAVREALRRTGLSLRVELGPNPEKWRWGRLHPLRFRPFGWPARAWAGPLDGRRWPFGGDGVTIAVGEYDPASPYEVRVISAYRLVVDLASPSLALSALAPGESEHPGDPRRDAGVGRWLAGRPALLATHPFVVDEGAQARLVLVPASADAAGGGGEER